MHLYVRTDASREIGIGHVMRCIALAQAWKDQGGEATFISYCESDAISGSIIQEGFNLIAIEHRHPHPADLAQTLNVIKGKAPIELLSGAHSQPFRSSWVVLDGYHFTPYYQKAIRLEGYRLLVVDDINHLPWYHADILLNQNIHSKELDYHCDKDTTLALGSRYVLLRREFLNHRNFKRRIPRRGRNILVTLGGADPDNVTLKIIEALKFVDDPKIECKIIVGPANPQQTILLQAITSTPSRFKLLMNPPKMPELMTWADLAVSAGGSTCWEMAYMGLPSCIVVLAENQKPVADILHHLGVSINLGWFADLNSEETLHRICNLIDDRDLRQTMSSRGRSIIQGSGGKDVIDAMLASFD